MAFVRSCGGIGLTGSRVFDGILIGVGAKLVKMFVASRVVIGFGFTGSLGVKPFLTGGHLVSVAAERGTAVVGGTVAVAAEGLGRFVAATAQLEISTFCRLLLQFVTSCSCSLVATPLKCTLVVELVKVKVKLTQAGQCMTRQSLVNFTTATLIMT